MVCNASTTQRQTYCNGPARPSRLTLQVLIVVRAGLISTTVRSYSHLNVNPERSVRYINVNKTRILPKTKHGSLVFLVMTDLYTKLAYAI